MHIYIRIIYINVRTISMERTKREGEGGSDKEFIKLSTY